ncbi:hypothetical protein OFB65_25080, partial [Escherichia coli]|nr:hypothetical protein [Escherichia coli]
MLPVRGKAKAFVSSECSKASPAKREGAKRVNALAVLCTYGVVYLPWFLQTEFKTTTTLHNKRIITFSTSHSTDIKRKTSKATKRNHLDITNIKK